MSRHPDIDEIGSGMVSSAPFSDSGTPPGVLVVSEALPYFQPIPEQTSESTKGVILFNETIVGFFVPVIAILCVEKLLPLCPLLAKGPVW